MKKGKNGQHSYKLNDDEFFAILRENGGLFARTARAIEATYKIPFTRQAVAKRANANPKILEDIREQNIDIAEEGLLLLMRDKNPAIRFKAIELYLKTIGKQRGYVERKEHDHKFAGDPDQIEWRLVERVEDTDEPKPSSNGTNHANE